MIKSDETKDYNGRREEAEKGVKMIKKEKKKNLCDAFKHNKKHMWMSHLILTFNSIFLDI